MKVSVRIAALATMVFAGPMALTANPASASTVEPACGDVITHSIRLSHDLGNCPGQGLVVGADGITIDLGGHALRGNGGSSLTDGVGVWLDGFSHVKVRNGEVAGFTIGVLLVESGSHNVISNLNTHGNGDKGIVLFGDGLTDNKITNNRLHDDGDGGIGIFNGATDTVVTRNTLIREAGQGVENNFADGSIVTRNTIRDTGSGVIVESSDHVRITDNVIRREPASACDGCGIGVQIYGNDILVARNTITDAERFGIELDDFQDAGHTPAVGNIIRDNVVRRAGIGIAIGPEAGGVVLKTVIRDNLVVSSVHDGIQLTGPSTGLDTSTLTGNIANWNGDWGIEAVAGTIDGGHNRARGNGEPAQCLNIACVG